jgi:membrane-associated phospholipid phosphatase
MIPSSWSSDKRAIGLVLTALATVVAFFVLIQRFPFFSKILMVVLILLVGVFLKKTKLLFRDWFVFLAFLYLFDSLRGLIYILTCKLQLPAYTLYVLNIEKALFGGIPSVALQNLLLRPDPMGNFTWLEKSLTVCYGSHFVAFLFVGLLIWLSRPKEFSLYKSSFTLLIFLGELAYALVPTVPPWMASSQFGLIPPLTRFNAVLFNLIIPDITSGFDMNPIAAMPSLHAGFPILCSLLLWRFFRWKGTPFYLYTLSVLFAIVYSGDHYVTDVIAGLALAIGCYLLAMRIPKKRPPLPKDEPKSDVETPFGRAVMRKRLLLGLGIFFVGIVLGGINKAQFVLQKGYDLNVPKYVDFIGNPERYRDSYLVQTYFGNHFLARNDHRTALRYFERSLELARTPLEKRESQMRISFCLKALDQNN